MPRYVSMHSIACLTRQGAEQLIARMSGTAAVETRRVLVNTVEGKMMAEFEAADRETLEEWLASEQLRFDWLLRVELESTGGKLEAV